ncbi:MAG: DUF2335 domain-containing protein [Bacteroidetes bacterium]|nr:DUF2335 domain-containing protein [Bacteroidota bacterium]
MAKTEFRQNPAKQEQIVNVKQVTIGPVPDPETLARYNQIDPAFTQTIFRMAEKEQEERLKNNAILVKTEAYVKRGETKSKVLGQIFAILSVVFLCCLCAYAFFLGFPIQASAIAGTVIISLAVVFVKGRKDTSS